MAIALTFPDSLDPADQGDVRALAASVAAEDGQPPLSDQALTRLDSSSVRHIVARLDERLVGYAQRAGESLEAVAAPEALPALVTASEGGQLLAWSHGRRSRLEPVLAERGFERVRTLHQLRRSLADAPGEAPPLPPATEIRAFVVGRDEDDWVRVNAAAFAHHPEQGSWTRRDIDAREAEPWFDPSGFLLAWHASDLVGFHWTKVHPDGLGEVYVIGVAPSTQGSGLGKVLLERGLSHLRERGCPQVLLYVDDDNGPAMRLYERAGFVRYDRDVQWRRASPLG